jgi:hypothetical protein
MKAALLNIFGNTILFYVIVSIPLLVDIFYVSPVHGPTAFFIVLLVCIFVFSPFTDGFRLAAVGKIRPSELRKVFIPFYSDILHFSKPRA